MYCFRCNHEIGESVVCPVCQANLYYFQKARKLSNAYYNDGLEKASVRNISGAIISLKKSLKFYKYNTNARNLLGLCFLETGETVEAISEWVVSMSFQPEDNRAGYYLEEIQNNKSHLETINQTIKKYNQALLYCQQDSRDLAIIQLKKVLSLNPKLVKGHQLLALLYLQEGKLDLAKKALRNAGKVDTDNTITLRYLKEVNRRLKEENPNKKNAGDDLISYQSGNETIIMPRHLKQSSLGGTLLAVIIGIVIGCAATACLVVPAVKRSAIADAKQQILDANEIISQNTQMISTLNAEIDRLEDEIDAYNEADAAALVGRNSYDALLSAYSAVEEQDFVTAGSALAMVDTSNLSDAALEVYNQLNEDVGDKYIAQLFEEGIGSYDIGDYSTAVADLTTVVEQDMAYEDGQAVYYLAQALRKSGDESGAEQYYQFVIDNYPGTERARTAANYVSQ